MSSWKVVDVSIQREVPERWHIRLIQRGFVDGRGGDRPSLSALARATGLHATTISNAIHGTTRPDPNTLLLLQRELGDDVAGWFGVSALSAWEPPVEAALLTDRQRKAVAELILAMTEQQEHHDGTATTRAGKRPATDDPGMPYDLAAKRADRERPHSSQE